MQNVIELRAKLLEGLARGMEFGKEDPDIVFKSGKYFMAYVILTDVMGWTAEAANEFLHNAQK